MSWGTMLFPIDDLLDEVACYRLLLSALHPKGLHCPDGHDLPTDQAPHDRHREPVVDYRCRACGKVFNLFTNTPLQGVGIRSPAHVPSGVMGRRSQRGGGRVDP
jgi:hypothetical protein